MLYAQENLAVIGSFIFLFFNPEIETNGYGSNDLRNMSFIKIFIYSNKKFKLTFRVLQRLTLFEANCMKKNKIRNYI